MDEAFWGSLEETSTGGANPLTCANCGELLPEGGDIVLTCPACGQGHRSLSPPKPTGDTKFHVGDRVAVLWGEHWWAAHVVEVVSETQRRIHYEGWAPSFDEVVDEDRIRLLDYEPTPSIVPARIEESELRVKRANLLSAAGIVLVLAASVGLLLFWLLGDRSSGVRSDASSAEAANVGGVSDRVPGKALTPGAPVQKGQTYYVKWGDGWYRGTVLEVISAEEIVIQYDGWSVDHNEIVTRDRLRVLQ